MSNGAVRELVTLLEAGYRADTEHSILGALWTVSEEEWTARLAPEGRSIREIVRHVAIACHAYFESAFGDGPPSWERCAAVAEGKVDRGDLMAWLEDGHHCLVEAVSSLVDADLDAPRANHWGEMVPTRRILLTLIGHAYYHAGEINHLRSVLQGNDRWEYWGDEMPAP